MADMLKASRVREGEPEGEGEGLGDMDRDRTRGPSLGVTTRGDRDPNPMGMDPTLPTGAHSRAQRGTAGHSGA